MAVISLVGFKRALMLQLEPDIGKRYRIHNSLSSLNLKSLYLEQILVNLPSQWRLQGAYRSPYLPPFFSYAQESVRCFASETVMFMFG